ncbi:MAG: PAS domain-containing protein [Rhodospirillaceae bacterium]|nr:PAS domain-containing protein [Rhodospirillaceae bacterium]
MGGEASALNRFFNIEESRVCAETQFLSAKTRRLYEWWAGANGGRMPTRRMFDVTEHRAIVASLFLTEVTREGEFVFRLLGEEVIQMIGRNPTGDVVKRIGSAAYGHALHEYYRSIVASRECRKCFGSLAFADKDFRYFESIDCPLSNDGLRVDYIVGAMDLVG